MDPDGRSLIFAALAFAVSLVPVYALGAFTELDTGEDEDAALLGVTPLHTAAAVSALGLFALALFFAARWLGRWPLAALPAALLVPTAYLLAFSLGAARHPDTAPEGRAARLFAALLGRPFLLAPRLVFKAAGLSAKAVVTEEDVLSLVDDVEEGEFIDENQKEMISGVFELDDVTAGELMTHRTEVQAVEAGSTVRSVLPLALEKGYSRLPVYKKNLDEIEGILYVKDLLRLVEDPEGGDAPVQQYLRPAMFVPESCRARELLVEFRARRTQMAVVVDEYGGTAGVVTMEDVLEEIVGNIEDEFDPARERVRPAEGGLLADGAADLEEVFAWFGRKLPQPQGEEDEKDFDFDSVSGLITGRLGRIPRPGEEVSIRYGALIFRVLQVGERRVEKVFVREEPEKGAQDADRG